MRDGFYSIAVAPADQPNAGGSGILAHFKDGAFVGVDQGGCRLHGRYQSDADGRVAIHLIYDFKAGSELISGITIPVDTSHEADLLLAPGTLGGDAQLIDLGLGPSLIRLTWLAEPA